MLTNNNIVCVGDRGLGLGLLLTQRSSGAGPGVEVCGTSLHARMIGKSENYHRPGLADNFQNAKRQFQFTVQHSRSLANTPKHYIQAGSACRHLCGNLYMEVSH